MANQYSIYMAFGNLIAVVEHRLSTVRMGPYPPTPTIVQEQCSVVTSTDMQILKSSSAAVSAVTGRSGVLVTAPVHSQGP